MNNQLLNNLSQGNDPGVNGNASTLSSEPITSQSEDEDGRKDERGVTDPAKDVYFFPMSSLPANAADINVPSSAQMPGVRSETPVTAAL